MGTPRVAGHSHSGPRADPGRTRVASTARVRSRRAHAELRAASVAALDSCERKFHLSPPVGRLAAALLGTSHVSRSFLAMRGFSQSVALLLPRSRNGGNQKRREPRAKVSQRRRGSVFLSIRNSRQLIRSHYHPPTVLSLLPFIRAPASDSPASTRADTRGRYRGAALSAAACAVQPRGNCSDVPSLSSTVPDTIGREKGASRPIARALKALSKGEELFRARKLQSSGVSRSGKPRAVFRSQPSSRRGGDAETRKRNGIRAVRQSGFFHRRLIESRFLLNQP
jgi:hypothetical protein